MNYETSSTITQLTLLNDINELFVPGVKESSFLLDLLKTSDYIVNYRK